MLILNCALVSLALIRAPQGNVEFVGPKNLRIVVDRAWSGGKMTLEGDLLAITEPPLIGKARVFAYTPRHAAPELVTIHDGLFSSVTHHVQVGRFLVTVGREVYAGDLNGDGDTLDYGSIVYDMQSGEMRPPFAVPPEFDVGHGLAAFTVPEWQDGRDWNGDHDLGDLIPVAWDLELGVPFHPQIDSVVPRPCSDGLVVSVAEYRVHQDLTNDGDQNDTVYHAFDFVDGSMTSMGFAHADLPEDEAIRIGDRAVAFVGYQPGQDVLHAYGFDRRVVDELEPQTIFLDIECPFTYAAVGRWVAFGRSEIFGTDWNQDGDHDDLVLFTYDTSTGEAKNTQLALGSWFYSFFLQPLLDSRALGFHVQELYQGADLNGDGDQFDSTLHILDLESGSIRNTHIGGLVNDGILYVYEQWDGIDRNGDGDALDTIPWIFGGATGPEISLGVASGDVRLGPEWAAVRVWESQQEADLNGDGDQTDGVLHSYERATGRLVNLRLPISGGYDLALSGHTVGVAVRENGTDDWNGDGDRDDDVFHLIDLKRSRCVNLGLAASGRKPALLSDSLFAFAVNELRQGADLDGNGAIENVGVVHVAHAPFFRPVMQAHHVP